MPKSLIQGFECNRCGHKWVPRNQEESPVTCPKCSSPYWNKERKFNKERQK